MLWAMADTIVVGYDGEDDAEHVLAAAIDAARAGGGTLVVAVAQYMPVDPGMPSMVYDASGSAVPLPDPDPELPPVLEPVMARARTQVEAAGIEADYIWGLGDPAKLIVDTARDRGASKIVIGTTHQGFFGRMFGDDVEAEVKREAGCEVFVID
jgi:nucleotide-binding universal stress UspA family protein